MAAGGWRSPPVMRSPTSTPTPKGSTLQWMRPESRPKPVPPEDTETDTGESQSEWRQCVRQTPHIPVKNMMCAFGVPGNMIHGTPGAAFSVMPVDAIVAPGMYTT